MNSTTSIANENDGHKPRILVVDDTPANLRMMMQMLSAHGYIVHPAATGDAALLFVQSMVPDIILLDIVMPGMNGYQLCERLKANERIRDVPVIFVSSADQELDKMKAFASGGVDYIVRPLQTEEMLARIKTHLSLRNLQKRLEEMVQERTAELTRRTAELLETNARLQKENAERRQAEERILYMSHYDALTGLPNRVLLQDRITQDIAYAERNMTQVAVLFVDLDCFKHINDSLGHQIGDRLLQATAQRLQQCLRKGDSVARIGGDEFVLSLPVPAGSDVGQVARKVLDALAQPFHIEGHELHMGGSIGISLYPDDGSDAQTLMRSADTAMYHAKEKARGNYQFFTPRLNTAAQQRLALGNRLRHALAQNELVLHYQPQVDMESGAIFSAEALLRCPQSAGRAPVSCGEFIAIAEETGLILPIGEWVLRQACRQLKQWHDDGHPGLRIAVNLSSRQFSQPDFVSMIEDALGRAGLPASALDLEITESLLLQRNEDNVAVLKRLSDMGVQLSIDDFGTGYSSLAYLQRFPVHALKIDRSFISGIDCDMADTALVAAVIAMAHSLHLKVLAEGVETAQQVSFLKSHGCLAAQGFFYSKPVPADVFAELLRNPAFPTAHVVAPHGSA